MKYTSFDFPFSSAFSGVKTESFAHVRLPYAKGNAHKILIVLDYMPTEDLRSGKLLSGVTGDTLNMLLKLSQQLFVRRTVDPSWMACAYNAYRTAGKPQQYQQLAREEFTVRLNEIIDTYKPDVVLAFGRQVMQALIPKQIELTDGKWSSWLGVPVRCRTKKKHSYNFVSSLSLNPLSDARSTDSALIGYMARNIANALANEHMFCVDAARIKAHKSVLVDTVAKFDKMLDMLASHPFVSCDTEANNLNRIVNKLLIIQFAKCPDYGYVVPIYHKDTPFDPEELKYIIKRLRMFFEGRNKNTYHIYANAQFDLNLNRTQLRTRFMANDVWDIFGGEFAHDENMKHLGSVTGDWYYSLGNLAVQYGSTEYLTGTFGKEDRANIANTPLEELLRYCSLDVVLPWAICEQQKLRATHMKHAAYETLVSKQISDTLHVFSRMETNGSGLDVKYLFHLKSPASPIEATIKKMEQKFLDSPNVQKANALLVKKAGITTQGLFAGRTDNLFSLRKDEHKQLLFFKVMKLKALSRGAAGKDGSPGNGKLDKEFQEHYKGVAEVADYTEMGQAKKLKNAFVNSFIKLLGTSDDLKHDHRIRPRYNYLPVVTNRTSASDPNLQQIPSRSELGKNIKRLFIARVGCLYVKVDYRVHEVRGWGLISFDKGVAELFKAAKALRDAYRLKPTPELKVRLKSEADIHIMNAAYFFGVPVDKVDKALRNDVKGVIFGLIYQMSIKTLAGVLGKTLEFTQELVKNFQKRFPNGMKWIQDAKTFAQKNLYYENPIGFRRHLWGYCLPESCETSRKAKADADRRAVNAPIQGMCSEFMSIGARALDVWINKIRVKEKRIVDIQIENSVHDSLENTAAYINILESVAMIEESLTKRVREIVYQRHGFSFVVDLEIDFDIGATLSGCQAWDMSIVQLEQHVFSALCEQKFELGHDIDVVACMKTIFVDGWDRGPAWMHQQAKNIGWKFNVKQWKERYTEFTSTAASKQVPAKA